MKKLTSLLFVLAVLACEDPDHSIEPIEIVSEAPETEETIHDDEVFTVVEKQAQFPGGQSAYTTFLQENLRYPNAARQMGVQGRVFASFIVSKTGKISDIKLVRGIGAGCDEEVVRLLRTSPDWIPGEQRGQQVHSRSFIAITFKLDNTEEIEVPIEEVHEKLLEFHKRGKLDKDSEIEEVVEKLKKNN